MSSINALRINDPASFRDPAGVVFSEQGEIYRAINDSYLPSFELLFESGLYENLTSDDLLIQCRDSDLTVEGAAKVVKAHKVPFISYPYEWCFSQLRDAALLTLEVQERALKHGMTLKDASAYNVQFLNGKPIFIDLLSFERLNQEQPWNGYRQFTEQFIAPLALAKYSALLPHEILRSHLDGINLSLASKILPLRSYLNFGVAVHIHSQSLFQRNHEKSQIKPKKAMSLNSRLALLDSLKSLIKSFSLSKKRSHWSQYDSTHNYSTDAQNEKRQTVNSLLESVKPQTVWDLGANTGEYSRLAAKKGPLTISFEMDHQCVERSYREQADGMHPVLPLVMDLSNPSPSLGWAHEERKSLADRGTADLCLVLALIHHLRIGNNTPFDNIASYLSKIGKKIIVEWIEKDDSQVQILLSSREDIYSDYTQEEFELAFEKYFKIESKNALNDTKRTIYLMSKLSG